MPCCQAGMDRLSSDTLITRGPLLASNLTLGDLILTGDKLASFWVAGAREVIDWLRRGMDGGSTGMVRLGLSIYGS